jgi:hypothetical protein
VKLTYLIRAHHKPRQLARLIRRLRAEDVSFAIHVDARAPDSVFSQMRSELADVPEVEWLPRVRTYYAGFSLVEAVLVGLRRLAADPPDAAVLLSGQDYPLRPGAEIRRFLAEGAGRSYLEYFRLPTGDHWPGERGGLDRIEHVHFEHLRLRTRILRLPLVRRPFPAGLTPYGGSAWMSLSGDAVRYLVELELDRPDLVRFFHRVRAPEEIFFQTVLLSSPLRDTVENLPLHHIEWPGGSHPKTLGLADLPALAESGRLFARKFDLDADEAVLDAIDRELLGVPVETSR